MINTSGKKNKLETCNNDSGKLWKNIRGWLNWSSSGSPTKLYHAGQIVTSPSKLANIMNQFFIGKIDKIRIELPTPTGDPLSTLKTVMKDRTSTFSFSCIHPETVQQIILSLKILIPSFCLDLIKNSIVSFCPNRTA